MPMAAATDHDGCRQTAYLSPLSVTKTACISLYELCKVSWAQSKWSLSTATLTTTENITLIERLMLRNDVAHPG